MKNILLGSLGLSLVIVLVFAGYFPATAGAAEAKCARESKVAVIAQWCKAGGQSAVKKEMKAFVKKTKAAGIKVTCLNCHTKLGKDYPVKANAVADFEKNWKAISVE